MKPQLIIFGVLVAGYISYNLFFRIADERTNTVVNILFASVIFAYIAFMAFSLLKKMKK
ncbi:hypothetical protein [Chryseobacterium sp. SN22]|uniref:hypothetical protein n=1 Tax=Chryseobacterium sp. SN22 TaxID=2606431 RepID=UPI00162A86CE|nr:hypothetical protein [Chryseobacterium sp. SN22]